MDNKQFLLMNDFCYTVNYQGDVSVIGAGGGGGGY